MGFGLMRGMIPSYTGNGMIVNTKSGVFAVLETRSITPVFTR